MTRSYADDRYSIDSRHIVPIFYVAFLVGDSIPDNTSKDDSVPGFGKPFNTARLSVALRYYVSVYASQSTRRIPDGHERGCAVEFVNHQDETYGA